MIADVRFTTASLTLEDVFIGTPRNKMRPKARAHTVGVAEGVFVTLPVIDIFLLSDAPMLNVAVDEGETLRDCEGVATVAVVLADSDNVGVELVDRVIVPDDEGQDVPELDPVEH